MKIQKFSFSHHRENWHIDEVSFDDFNLLVGPSGVGKTRILKALELIFDVALGREKLDDFEWTIHFSHLNKSYTWFLKSAIPENEDIFEIESKQFEVIEERLIQVENKTEIFHITSSFSKLNNVKLPKIKKTESAISLFPEEDLIFPLIEAFERIISSKSLNQLNKVKSTKLIPSIHSFNKQLVTNIKNTLFKNINRIQDLQDFFKQTTVNLEPLEKLLSLFMFQKRYADYEENDFDFFKNGFEWIKKHYLDIFTNVINIRIGMEENSDNTVSIFLEIQDTDSEEWIPQERMSSGMFRTLIYIIEVITAPEGSVILIDEFENSLGINCMSEVTDFILDHADSLQFIITSHHPYIINNIPWQDWQIVSRKGSHIKTKKATEISALNTASSLDKFTQLINVLDSEEIAA